MNQNAQLKPGRAGLHPLIIRKEGRYCVYLPELHISGVGDSLEDAYREFEACLQAFEQRNAVFDLTGVTPEPFPPLRRRAVVQALALGFGKAAVGAVAVALVFVALLPNIGAALRNQAKSFVPVELREPAFWAVQLPLRVNAQLDRLPPAEAEQMTKEWLKLSERASPLFKPLSCPSREVAKSQSSKR